MAGQSDGVSKLVQVLLLFVFASYMGVMSQDASVIADTRWGRIQGLRKKTRYGTNFYSFEGVPYAQPPIGRLRFAKPVPLRSRSSGVYKAHSVKPSCFGVGVFGLSSEDCLYLDIYVPAPSGLLYPPQTSARSVMVFIHGGGFVAFGSLNMDALMFRGGAIVVFVHYRLGPFGFLSTGERDLPGNFGLWDQHMALLWVKANIAGFGGDPSTVTIFGYSAGGASVGYQALAPPSRGLFQRAILMSGAPSGTWAIQRNPKALTLQLAKSLNCRVEGRRGVLPIRFLLATCLRRKQPSLIFQKGLELTFQQDLATKVAEFVFVPVVDGEFVTEEPLVMLGNQSHLLNLGVLDKDFIIGVVNNEGSLMFGNLEVPQPLMFGDFFAKALIPKLLAQRFGKPAPSLAINAVLREYSANITRSLLSALGMAHAFGDPAFVVPALDFSIPIGNLQSEFQGTGRTYVYYFDFCPSFSPILCTMHGLDLLYLAPLSHIYDKTDAQMSQMYIELLTNFARTGIPLATGMTQQWATFNKNSNYAVLRINPKPKMYAKLFESRRKLWLEKIPGLMEET